MESKFVGVKFGDWKVVDYFTKNPYKKSYKNGKLIQHNAVTYHLINQVNHYHMTLSGNTLRQINNGTRKIEDIINSSARGCKNNKELVAYRKLNRGK